MARINRPSAQIIPFPSGAPSRALLDQRINWLRTAQAAKELDQSLARRAYLVGFMEASLKFGGRHA